MTPAPRIGTEFAGYRIEGLLGRGGMGVVYRAEHPRLGASIALKVMDPALAMDEVFRERFLREARMAARIKHPSIIPIYDAGEWQGDLYMAMRYIEGRDLRSQLRANGVLQIHETQAIGLQIAGALDAAHRNGLVHRDVKPANILLEPGADPDTPQSAYLGDLGLTKQTHSIGDLTASGELLGTIDYMAPEQISGSLVDGRADLYSLACVLFECLTGSPPYVRENKAAVLWAHLHDEIPRATAVNPRLPNAIDEVLARGMAKKPEDRYPTGRELVAALQAPLQAAPPAVPDETETRPLRVPSADKPVSASSSPRRGRMARALALAAALGALVGGGVAAAVMLLVPEETDAPTTSQAGTTTPTTTRAALTPFDEALLPNVPEDIRPSCRHARPPADEFDATVSCRPGGAVDSVTYSHARSGRYLSDFFFEQRVSRVGIDATARPLQTLRVGNCGGGDVPSVNATVAIGLGGRLEVAGIVTSDEQLGVILCAKTAHRARIEWLTLEIAVYAIARGKSLPALYEWWRTDAGPEP
jgi:serine/threonine protein kinase